MRKYIKIFTTFLVFAAFITSCENNDHTPQKEKSEEALKQNVIDVELGGPNEPNNVYIDLSTGNTKVVRRDTYELGFYNGAENRVFLNASLLVTAAPTEFTDIDAVTSESTFKTPLSLYFLSDPATGEESESEVTSVKEFLEGLRMGYTMFAPKDHNAQPYTDNKQGTLDGTAFGEIPDSPAQAPIFIVSVAKIPEGKVDPGAIASHDSEYLPFYKVKIFMQDAQHYVIHYAHLDETTHKEAVIAKDDNYNLSFFSLAKGKTVEAAPPKANFDIDFAGTFSYFGNVASPHSFVKGKYWTGVIYSDYALTNNLGGTSVYAVVSQKKAHPEDRDDKTLIPTGEPLFEDFTKEKLDPDKFIKNDRSVIGSNYRKIPPEAILTPGLYYIIKDSAGNIYKLKFTAFMNEKRERGYPQFKYELVQSHDIYNVLL